MITAPASGSRLPRAGFPNGNAATWPHVPRSPIKGQGTEKKETSMGKLRLEASWCKGSRNSGKVLIELDLMFVFLLAKLAVVALQF